MAAFIDCDLYDSYMDSLNFIWPRLSKKGLIQLDEYYSLKFPGPRIASMEFLKKEKIKVKFNKTRKTEFKRCYLKK